MNTKNRRLLFSSYLSEDSFVVLVNRFQSCLVCIDWTTTAGRWTLLLNQGRKNETTERNQRERERDRERQRQRDRDREKETEIETETETDRHTERRRETGREKETESVKTGV